MQSVNTSPEVDTNRAYRLTVEFNKVRTPDALLDAALLQVESVSIRGWVTAQRDVWIKILTKAARSTDPEIECKVAAYIICTAIGA